MISIGIIVIQFAPTPLFRMEHENTKQSLVFT